MLKINKYCNNPSWIAAITAFFAGIAIHLFALANVIQNYDNIYVPRGYGSGITLGRWLLTILGEFLDKRGLGYNVPVLWGITFILFLAIAAYYIVRIFNMKSRLFAALVGIICVCFPTITSTMYFRYTVIYYGLAIVLSVLAAYVAINAKNKVVTATIVSALLVACSLGIYQAYLPLTISIFVLYLIQQALIGEESWQKLFYRGLYYCLCLVLGLVAYFVLLKVCLHAYGAQLSTYQGVDSMGKMQIGMIPQFVLNAFTTFFTMPVNNYYSLAPIKLLAHAYILVEILTIIMIGIIIFKKKPKALHALLTILLVAIFPVAVNFIVIMCPDSKIYTLMVYSFITVLIAPLVVFEAVPEPQENWIKAKKIGAAIIAAILIVITFTYSYLDNVNYTRMYYVNRQVENYFSSMITQVRMTEGFSSDMKWAFLGSVQDPLLNNSWQTGPFYDGGGATETLINSYSNSRWISTYVGYEIPYADEKTEAALYKNDVVKEMPCWPDYGSIQVVDDVVVIKLSEPKQNKVQ